MCIWTALEEDDPSCFLLLSGRRPWKITHFSMHRPRRVVFLQQAISRPAFWRPESSAGGASKAGASLSCTARRRYRQGPHVASPQQPRASGFPGFDTIMSHVYPALCVVVRQWSDARLALRWLPVFLCSCVCPRQQHYLAWYLARWSRQFLVSHFVFVFVV